MAGFVLVFCGSFFEQHRVQLVLVHQSVHEPQLQSIGGNSDAQVVDVPIKLIHGHAARRGNVTAHPGPKIFEQSHKLLLVGFAQIVAQVGLYCTLVGVVWTAYDGHFYPEVFQHALVKSGLHPHAPHVHSAFGVQVHFVGHCGHPISALGVDLAPSDNPFAGCFELSQGIAYLTQHGRVTGNHVGLNQNPLDVVVVCRALHVGQEVVEAHLGLRLHGTELEGERQLHSPLCQRRIKRQKKNRPLFDVPAKIQVHFRAISCSFKSRSQAPHQGTNKNENEQ